MGKTYPEISNKHQEFIQAQQMFFVATAPKGGHLNLSPKGLESLHIINSNRVLWLNYTGSSNETAAHLREDDRMTIMFCAFEGDPKILRLYGHARTIHPRDDDWEALLQHFPDTAGARQLIEMDVELVHTSCGFGVPLYSYRGQRDTLTRWIDKKGEVGITQYWADRNVQSLDGKPTGIFED
ncbi:MAG: pyridoxamine 5'-phosphate oxidase family protein [Candidatus Polarisedimenticolaceae bacterium]|nr:pyridoxamine 5'-phosphate oxidase family protein [Candidatus Polarisedimenticolaceae bacterium]